MKLWLLRPVKTWNPWYDKCFGMVIRTADEADARLLASGEAGDEGGDVWLDHAKTTCEELTLDGEREVVM
jgi:hypothetical protein